MDWTNIIITLITSSAFTGIYLLGDKKTSQVLENVNKTIEQWRGLVEEVKGELTEQRAEFRRTKTEYEEQIKAKDNKIDSLYKETGVWRDRNDKLSSKIAYYRAFECRKTKCSDREPPFGSGAFSETEGCAGCAGK